MKKELFFTFALVFFLTGCHLFGSSQQITPQISPVPAKEEAPSPAPEQTMSEKEARQIAESSDCVKEGTLKETAFYNPSTETWWIDLEIDKPGCNPACVISQDKTTEINWRCTGLIED